MANGQDRRAAWPKPSVLPRAPKPQPQTLALAFSLRPPTFSLSPPPFPHAPKPEPWPPSSNF